MAQSSNSVGQGRKIFYGWWIVTICLLVLFVHSGCGFYSFGVLNKPLQAAFDTSRGAISGAVSLFMLMAGLVAPFVGRLTDNYGPKRILLFGGVIAGAALMLLSLANALWQLYVLYSVIGIGLGSAGAVPISVAISNWFTRRRGLAIGITMIGFALGALLVTLLTSYLIEAFSWRAAFLAMGILVWAFVIPPIALFMKTRPQDMGLLPDGDPPREVPLTPESVKAAADPDPKAYTMATALRSPCLWLMMTAFFFAGLAIGGVLQHEHAFFTDTGVSAASAGIMLAVTGGTGGLGKFSFGFLSDKISPRIAAMICFSLQLVAVIVLIQITTTAMMWVFVLLFGFAMGGQVALQPLVTIKFFGLPAFGSIFGVVALAASLGTAIGPILAGGIYDIVGSYRLAFITFAAGYAVAITALLLARQPKPVPATSRAERELA